MQLDETGLWNFVGGKDGLSDYLEKLDKKFSEEQMRIADRSFRVLEIIGSNSSMGITLTGDFSDAIEKWFEHRYGKRMSTGVLMGSVVILLNGAPYRVDFPYGYGSVRYDPLTLVKDATKNLFNSMDQTYLTSLAKLIHLHCQGMRSGGSLAGYEHLDTAIAHVMSVTQNVCVSRWETLLAVEKALKQSIRKLGGTPHRDNRGHNLYLLNEKLIEKAGRPLDIGLLDKVYCKPEIRYEEIDTTLDEAVSAIQAASLLRAKLSNFLQNDTQRAF